MNQNMRAKTIWQH